MTSSNATWLQLEILNGLQQLQCLNLEHSPASDVLPGTARAWAQALITSDRYWERERDTPRVRRAFTTLAANRTHWPAPRHLIEAMPTSTQQPRLERPTRIPEDREGRVRKLEYLLGQAFNPNAVKDDVA